MNSTYKRPFGVENDNSYLANLEDTVCYNITNVKNRRNHTNRQIIILSNNVIRNNQDVYYSMFYLYEFINTLNDYRNNLLFNDSNMDPELSRHVKNFLSNEEGKKNIVTDKLVEQIRKNDYLIPLISLSIDFINKFYFSPGIVLSHYNEYIQVQSTGTSNVFNYWGELKQGHHLFLKFELKGINRSWKYIWTPIKSITKFCEPTFIDDEGERKKAFIIYVGKSTKNVTSNIVDSLTVNKILGNTGTDQNEITKLLISKEGLSITVSMEDFL